MYIELEFISHSPEETQRIGTRLGELANPGDIFLLVGPLGAGKTCLTQGIARGLQVTERPRSPTFVLVALYHGRLPMHHMDLFRIDNPSLVEELGIEEYLDDGGICVVEWADKATDIFPPESLWIELGYDNGEEERRVKIHAEGSQYEHMIDWLRKTYKEEIA